MFYATPNPKELASVRREWAVRLWDASSWIEHTLPNVMASILCERRSAYLHELYYVLSFTHLFIVPHF